MSAVECKEISTEERGYDPKYQVGDFAVIANAPAGRDHYVGTQVRVLKRGPWFLPQYGAFMDYRVRAYDGKTLGLNDEHLVPATDVEKSFERERRYVVFKLKDLKAYVPEAVLDELNTLLEEVGTYIDAGRAMNGKQPFQAAVVESDWPEYETVWDMIEGRVLGEQAEAKRRKDKAYALGAMYGSGPDALKQLAERGITPATLSAVGKRMDEQEVPQDTDRIDPYQAMAYAIYGRAKDES